MTDADESSYAQEERRIAVERKRWQIELPVYVARIYKRKGAEWELLHAQSGTLPELAILCNKVNLPADIAVGAGDPLGILHPDGRVEWV